MEEYGANTHLFVVKIWLEPIDPDSQAAIWRGHITHALEQEQQYLTTIQDIVTFIANHLEKTGYPNIFQENK